MAKSWATLGVDLHLDPPATKRHRRPPRFDGRAARPPSAPAASPPAPGCPPPAPSPPTWASPATRSPTPYADLVAEGWLHARRAPATHVAMGAPPTPLSSGGAPSSRPRQDPAPRPHSRPAYDSPPAPRPRLLPRTEWLKAARRAFTSAPAPASVTATRAAVSTAHRLATYLSRARGVRADPEHILSARASRTA